MLLKNKLEPFIAYNIAATNSLSLQTFLISPLKFISQKSLSFAKTVLIQINQSGYVCVLSMSATLINRLKERMMENAMSVVPLDSWQAPAVTAALPLRWFEAESAPDQRLSETRGMLKKIDREPEGNITEVYAVELGGKIGGNPQTYHSPLFKKLVMVM